MSHGDDSVNSGCRQKAERRGGWGYLGVPTRNGLVMVMEDYLPESLESMLSRRNRPPRCVPRARCVPSLLGPTKLHSLLLHSGPLLALRQSAPNVPRIHDGTAIHRPPSTVMLRRAHVDEFPVLCENRFPELVDLDVEGMDRFLSGSVLPRRRWCFWNLMAFSQSHSLPPSNALIAASSSLHTPSKIFW